MSKENTIEGWLEKNFPQQYVVDLSLRDLHPKNFYLNKHTALIALKSDPEVQFEVVWYKDKEDIGLSKDEIVEKTENGKRDVALARDWYKKLQSNGLDKFSVGVIDMAMYILPYGEPDAVFRKHVVESVFNTLKQAGPTAQTSIFIECMEDSCYHKEIQDIIPFGFWRRKDTYYDDNVIVNVDFEFTDSTEAAAINEHWGFNTKSKRSLKYMDEVYPKALEWANQHLKKPFYLEPAQYAEFELDEQNPFLVHYSFPFYPSQPDSSQVGVMDATGYVTGTYDTEKHTISSLRQRKDD